MDSDCCPFPKKPRPQGEDARPGSGKTTDFQTGPQEAPQVRSTPSLQRHATQAGRGGFEEDQTAAIT